MLYSGEHVGRLGSCVNMNETHSGAEGKVMGSAAVLTKRVVVFCV
jgi:hypothetical protein